jgi:hypothetical protein
MPSAQKPNKGDAVGGDWSSARKAAPIFPVSESRHSFCSAQFGSRAGLRANSLKNGGRLIPRILAASIASGLRAVQITSRANQDKCKYL